MNLTKWILVILVCLSLRATVIAIGDARAAVGDQQIIDRAAQEIIDGDADVTRDKFEEALADYALAWGNAQPAQRSS